MNLVFHQAALGDFVLTFPLLRALPDGTTMVAPWSKAALAAKVFRGVTPMDIELWEFTRLHASGGPTSLSPAIRELFEKSSLILSFISTGHDTWAANVQRFAPRAKTAFIEPRPPKEWDRPVGQWHLAQLREQNVHIEPAPPDRDGTRGGPIVVHPGSGAREKCWPIDRFEALMRALRDGGREVVVVMGEVEAERFAPEAVQRLIRNFGGKLLRTLDELDAILRSASLFVGNDSGPAHLAAQLGLPTVVLFGPSDPRVWAPQGPAVTVLAPPTPGPMDWLGVERVVAAIEASR